MCRWCLPKHDHLGFLTFVHLCTFLLLDCPLMMQLLHMLLLEVFLLDVLLLSLQGLSMFSLLTFCHTLSLLLMVLTCLLITKGQCLPLLSDTLVLSL